MNNLKLNKKIYNIKFIEECTGNFNDIVKINLEDNLDYWILHFSESIYDSKVTIKEFENYLIDLMYIKGLQ